jgi:hypothetical protein
MCHCAVCARAYPAELVACPSCGAKERLEEDTLSGAGQRDWGLELAAEAVERARTAASTADLERLLGNARLGLEQRLAEGQQVERRHVDSICLAAAQVSAIRSEAGWGRWALSIYASLGMAPPVELSDALARLPEVERLLLEPAVARALESASARKVPSDDPNVQALARLAGIKS